LPGAGRNILFEAYTNVSCPPCATNNPYLDSFIAAHFDTIVAIKYHTWWPSQNDPMYLHNAIENRNRVLYYPINNVPVLNVGVYQTYTHIQTAFSIITIQNKTFKRFSYWFKRGR
jgi:hypothetical protein